MPTPDAVLGALDLGSLKNMMFGARIEDELVRTNMELELDFDRGIGRILDSFGTEYRHPRSCRPTPSAWAVPPLTSARHWRPWNPLSRKPLHSWAR
jgi:hypothetical protein